MRTSAKTLCRFFLCLSLKPSLHQGAVHSGRSTVHFNGGSAINSGGKRDAFWFKASKTDEGDFAEICFKSPHSFHSNNTKKVQQKEA